MKRLLFLLLFLPSIAQGQDTDYYFRPFAGIGMADARFTGRGAPGTIHPLTTPYYGFEVAFAVSNRLHIIAGLSLFQTGYQVRDFPMPDGEYFTRPPDTGTIDFRFHQLAPVLGLRAHQPLGRRWFLGIQGALSASRITEITVEPDFPHPDRVQDYRFIDRSAYAELILLGIARADIGCRIGKSVFLSAGPYLTYTFSNLRPGNDGKQERHIIKAVDVGIGFML